VVVVAETALEPERHRDLGRGIKAALVEELGLTAVRPFPAPLGWLVKTTSGKISRKENAEKFLSGRA
jgi:hypothetical protein